MYRDGFQEVDLPNIFAPVSKSVIRPNYTARMPEHISTAFRTAMSDRPGPVYVECNEDVLYGEVDESAAESPTRATAVSPPSADPDKIAEAVKILSEAERPILLAGSGPWWSGAWEELQEFVDRTGIPFYTTPIARGLIPEDHPVSFPAARSTAFREADAVLVVGTRFNWIMTFGRRISPQAKIIQIDVHAAEIGHNRSVDIGIVADAKAAMRLINAEVSRSGMQSKSESAWVAYLRDIENNRRERSVQLENSEQVPIHPLRLCKELREVMDRDAILTADGNEILHYGRQSIPTYVPGHRLNSGATGCMGVGLPFAIGAKLAKPDKQVISLHGDGSLGMNIQDFDTAVRYNLPIVIVVSNNEGWTARVEGIRKPGRELGWTRFDAIAEALGDTARRFANRHRFDRRWNVLSIPAHPRSSTFAQTRPRARFPVLSGPKWSSRRNFRCRNKTKTAAKSIRTSCFQSSRNAAATGFGRIRSGYSRSTTRSNCAVAT